MNEQEIIAFKNELRNYLFYQSKIKELNDQLDVIYYNLTGVKGVSFDRQPSGVSPELKADRLYEAYGRIDTLKDKISLYKAKVDNLDKLLGKIEKPFKSLIIDLYVNGKTYKQVARQVNMSTTSIHYEINKQLERVKL